MVQTLQDIRGGGGPIKIVTTGTISALMSRELEARESAISKDYDGGILMECHIDPKLPYTDLSTMIRRQRQAIDEKIWELSNCHIVYPGIDFQKKEAGIPKKPIKDDVPGLREAGWTPDQYGHS
ncbi:hypothetical protein ACS0TY_035894 [Phlomoides rotata]